MNQWPELIPQLVANVTDPSSTEHMKESTLEAIGYICQDIVSPCLSHLICYSVRPLVHMKLSKTVRQDPEHLQDNANQILTAIIQGMRKEEPSNNVKLAATNALLNSLEFTKANFDKEVLPLHTRFTSNETQLWVRPSFEKSSSTSKPNPHLQS